MLFHILDPDVLRCLEAQELNPSVGAENPLKIRTLFSIQNTEEDSWGILGLEAHLKASIFGTVVPRQLLVLLLKSEDEGMHPTGLLNLTLL